MTKESPTAEELEALRIATAELEAEKLRLALALEELRQQLALERMRATSRAGRVPK